MGDCFGVGGEVVVYDGAWGGVGALGPDSPPELFDDFGLGFRVGGGGVGDVSAEGG